TYRIKDYPVCFYDPKYKIMANHHGIKDYPMMICHYFVFGVIETYRIKDYPVCFYDPKYKIMANHHGI
ncbi:DUF4049 domain-containing protein, partial [Shigella sonnei]|nr:DUF4049 domain-containing protein [Shigella sonnei]